MKRAIRRNRPGWRQWLPFLLFQVQVTVKTQRRKRRLTEQEHLRGIFTVWHPCSQRLASSSRLLLPAKLPCFCLSVFVQRFPKAAGRFRSAHGMMIRVPTAVHRGSNRHRSHRDGAMEEHVRSRQRTKQNATDLHNEHRDHLRFSKSHREGLSSIIVKP